MNQYTKNLIRDVRSLKIPFDDIPMNAWDDDDFVNDILSLYPRGFSLVEKRKNLDKKQLLDFINDINASGIYEYLSIDLKNDEDIIYNVIPWCIEEVPDKYLLVDKFIRRILKENPNGLSLLPHKIKENKDYVRIAVEINGQALIHASSILRSDIELILIALVYSKVTNDLILDRLGSKIMLGDEIRNDTELLLKLCLKLKKVDEFYEERIESILDILEISVSKDLRKKLYSNSIL
jgi:hypothetical protein